MSSETPAPDKDKSPAAKRPANARQIAPAARAHQGKDSASSARQRRSSAREPFSKAQVAVIIILAAAGLGTLVYFLTSEDPRNIVGTPEWLADRRSEYSRKYYELSKSNPDEIAALYQWCKQWPAEAFAKESEELLQRLCALKPDHPAGVEVRIMYEQKLADAAQANTEDGWVAVAEFCNRFNLKQECTNAAEAALKMNPDNAQANELLGRVAIVNESGNITWKDKAVVEERARLETEKLAKLEEEKRLGTRGRKIITSCEAHFKGIMEVVTGWKVVAPAPDLRIDNEKWVILDRRPYVYIMEKGGYSPTFVIEWVHERLCSLRKYFMEVYAKALNMQENEDDMLTIFYFMGRESYRRKTGIHEMAAAHYNRLTHALYIPHESDVSERDETLYHEAIHQIVDFAAGYRLGRRRAFWFEEGNATLFETFAKWDTDCPPSKILPNYSRLGAARGIIRRKEYIPFEDVLGMPYMEARIGYPQGWAMVFFLNTFQSGKYLPQWEEYMSAEIKGKGGKKAFKKIFGDLAALEKEWAQYILSDELMKED
jgi:hypothetical protein